jgi:iron complex outermembrane receptor protein
LSDHTLGEWRPFLGEIMLRRLTLRWVFLALTCTVSLGVHAMADERKSFDVPAGDLIVALKTLARQSGVELVYRSEQLEGLQTKGVSGTLAPQEAVTKLLQGTPLTVKFDPSGAMLIAPPKANTSQAPAQPMERASGAGEDPKKEDKTGQELWSRFHLAQLDQAKTSDASSAGPQSPESPGPGETNSSGGLQEIVVSARRREESIQNVPISIAAFSEASLKDRQITTTQGLSEIAPNVQFSPVAPSSGNSSASAIFIRGVGQTDFIASTDPGVGFYVDGVYFARAAGTAIALLDVNHIEVLRGPQGTLFGRNSSGGAIQILTNRPSLDRVEGEVSATFGDFARREGTGVLNVPLTDTFAIRVAATRRRQDGYVTNILSGRPVGGDNTFAVRVSALWKPTDSFDVLLEGDDVSVDTPGTPTVFGGINTAASFVGFAARDAGCPGYTSGPVPETVDPRCPNNQYLALGPYKVASEKAAQSKLDMWGAAVTATWRATDWMTLKSITGYRRTKPFSLRDADNTPLVILETINQDDIRQVTQEFQFLGDAFDSRLHWQAGAYYFRETDSQFYPVYLPVPQVGGLNSQSDIKNESYAFFTQESFDLTSKLNLTAGIRYTNDTKEATPHMYPSPSLPAYGFAGYGFYVAPNPAPLPGFVCLNAAPPGRLCTGATDTMFEQVLNKRTDSKVTPMGSLQYRWLPGLMTYFSYSQGYKSGGFNTRIIQPVIEPNDPTGRIYLPSFAPESVKSYEIGAKAEAAGIGRLSAAAFRANYDDIQIVVREGVAPVVRNAGAATIQGFELEGNTATLHGFSADFGVGYTHFRYDSLASSVIGIVPMDGQQAYTPEWSANLGVVYHLTTPIGVLAPRIDASYRSLTFFDSPNTAQISQPGYEVYNASLRWTDSSGRYSLGGGVTNFTDKAYRVSGNSSLASSSGYAEVTYAPPRQWFIQASASF